jgi:ArsR family transcriptional regulator
MPKSAEDGRALSKQKTPVNADACAERLRAVSDGERLRIVCFLQKGPRNVSEIAKAINMPVVNASHHLQVLRHAGLVHTERKGRKIFYGLADEVFPRSPEELDFGCCRLQIETQSLK